MPEPIRQTAIDHDLTSRFPSTSTVVASPQDNTETIVASLTIPNFNDIAVVSGVRLQGFAAFTIGTNGVSGNLKIHQTNASGATVAATGALTAGVWAATQLAELVVLGFDAAPGVATYVLTLTIASGSAASTVSAAHLSAVVI
jgi:hypothetical protein